MYRWYSGVQLTAGGSFSEQGRLHACALLRPSAESEYQLSEEGNLLVRAGYEVETVRLGERVNTPEDVGQAKELLRGV
ncbi:hypothetical protein C464_01636 [Halorubrum coriense DSM 10284]|uniref:Uncharacterized protein n=1 Tax=Halorubrum coriense DSM 10284 TaxID=1227466 RepID=M0EUL1_9EURY|nr:hypothetical protein [Halorubrum coriense]ELZ50783.1 hypothetical protein C464_01636 [Halorubrum coriense DSM 10284]